MKSAKWRRICLRHSENHLILELLRPRLGRVRSDAGGILIGSAEGDVCPSIGEEYHHNAADVTLWIGGGSSVTRNGVRDRPSADKTARGQPCILV